MATRFGDIPAGAVSEQTFDATDRDGDEVSLRNVLLTLPGDADRTIVIVAPRDSANAPGAASSAAATGILIELANAFRVSHEQTYVLASVSGSSAGAAGVQALIDELPERDSIEAVIVVSQPGAADARAAVLGGHVDRRPAPARSSFAGPPSGRSRSRPQRSNRTRARSPRSPASPSRPGSATRRR